VRIQTLVPVVERTAQPYSLPEVPDGVCSTESLPFPKVCAFTCKLCGKRALGRRWNGRNRLWEHAEHAHGPDPGRLGAFAAGVRRYTPRDAEL